MLAENEARCLRVSDETLHIGGATPQDVGGDQGGTVWNPQDNDFRTRCDAQGLEIGVPRDEDVPLLLGVRQDGVIGGSAQAAVAYVSRIRKEICDRSD